MSLPKKLLALVFYSLFTLAVLEAVFRLAYSSEWFLLRSFANESISWQRNWVWAHEKTGQEMIFSTDQYDPALGWRPRPDLRDEVLRGEYFVSTNALGFRSLEEVSPVKDRPRILILGDSFVFGDEANDDEILSYHLQQMMPEAEIINMGVRGYGQDQMLLYFREAGAVLEPDIVVVGFVTMDMERSLLYFRDYAKPLFALEGGNLVLTHSPVPSPQQVLAEDWRRPRLLDVAAFFYEISYSSSGSKQADMEAVTAAILETLAGEVRASGAAPLFVFFPSDHDIRANSEEPEGQRYLDAFCAEHVLVLCASAWPSFRQGIAEGAGYRQVGHWNEAGHVTAAEVLYNVITAQGLLP